MLEKTLVITPTILKSLKRLFTIEQLEGVSSFLEMRPYLVAFLEEAYAKFMDYFPGRKLILSLVPSVRRKDEMTLLIAVQADGERAETLATFNRLKLDWWRHARKQLADLIIITVRHKDIDSSNNGRMVLENLSGIYEGPEDWSAQHNHYLHGTPKE